MPKTKKQQLFFTVLMVFCMVFCMTVYTKALGAGTLNGQIFSDSIQEMWIEYIIVFLLIFFVITKFSIKSASQLINPKKDNPLFFTLCVQSITVMCIVPSITLIATFLHNGVTSEWFFLWIKTAVLCFPMAYFLQIFWVGPFVRFIFRNTVKLFSTGVSPVEGEAVN